MYANFKYPQNRENMKLTIDSKLFTAKAETVKCLVLAILKHRYIKKMLF
jgi:hypothetical protein